MTDFQPLPGQTPAEIVKPATPEQQKPPLLQSAQSLAKGITGLRPQQDARGQINYYFAGSLATNLLAGAETVEILDTKQLPHPIATETKVVPPEARTVLQGSFLRQVGDLDYIPLPNYQALQ